MEAQLVETNVEEQVVATATSTTTKRNKVSSIELQDSLIKLLEAIARKNGYSLLSPSTRVDSHGPRIDFYIPVSNFGALIPPGYKCSLECTEKTLHGEQVWQVKSKADEAHYTKHLGFTKAGASAFMSLKTNRLHQPGVVGEYSVYPENQKCVLVSVSIKDMSVFAADFVTKVVNDLVELNFKHAVKDRSKTKRK